MRWSLKLRCFTSAIAVVGLTMSLSTHTATSRSVKCSSKLRRTSADQVSKQVDAIRASAKLPPLTRVRPSREELELICTAALTGRKVNDPAFADLRTYVTHDLSAETETLKIVALGTRACSPDGETRCREYPEKWR